PRCPLKKVGRWHLEDFAKLLEATGADPVHALFVFLDLLKSEADVGPQLLLRHFQFDAPHSNAAADVDIDGIWRLRRHFFSHRQKRRSRPIMQSEIAKSIRIISVFI